MDRHEKFQKIETKKIFHSLFSRMKMDEKKDENDQDQDQEPEHDETTNLSPISTSSSGGCSTSSDYTKKTNSCKKQSRFSGLGSSGSSSHHQDTGSGKIIIIDNDDDDDSDENNERDIDRIIYSRFEKKYKDSWNNNHKANSNMARKMNRMSSSSIDRLESRHHTKMTNRKHISLDDDIVQIESDSSLMVSGGCRRRQNVHAHARASYAGIGFEDEARTVSFSKDAISMEKHTQIVSILKRKDSSTSSNTSLVTFSPNVIDTKSTPRQGILKKRSSLDESRYIRRRSHSPSSASSADEKSCLKDGRRRNSFEEPNHHHGILKQKSYDSSSATSGFNTNGSSSPNTTVHGILKKPSSSTPSESHYHSADSTGASSHPTKHVSISEAVILAAAEICKSMIIVDDQEETKPKPILKLDHDYQRSNKIKPILKKNHSSENEGEIRSILKTSRKSSREESFYSDS